MASSTKKNGKNNGAMIGLEFTLSQAVGKPVSSLRVPRRTFASRREKALATWKTALASKIGTAGRRSIREVETVAAIVPGFWS